MPVKREILYPIFLECCTFAEDMFWESVFEDLAYGKVPYGAFISNKSICCTYKDKQFVYKIEDKDPQTLYTEVYNVLSKKLSVSSQKDKTKKTLEFYDNETDSLSYNSWTAIRKKNVQDYLVEDYVIRMKKQHSLSLVQTKYLQAVILVGRSLKLVTARDIVMEDGRIESIKCISFSRKKIFLEKDLSCTMSPVASAVVLEKSRVSDLWSKYLESLSKLQECYS